MTIACQYIQGLKCFSVFFSLFCLIAAFHAVAQRNLVGNPGFDILHQCPTNAYPNLDNAKGWFSGVPEGAVPRRTTIFNSCAPESTRLSVPFNTGFNYQPARSGSGYAGLYVFISTYINGPSSYLEYAETKLNEKLSRNKQYYLEYYTTPQFNSHEDGAVTNTFIGSMGIALSDSERNAYDPANGFHRLRPIVEHSRKKTIKDTSGWTRINGSFVAKGTEEYLLIGNFNRSTDTYVETLPEGRPPGLAYYFIEDVGVFEFDPLPDTLYLCPGESRTLSARFLDGIYSWSNGSSDSTIEVSTPGVYYVDVALGAVSMRDSVVVIAPGLLQHDRDTSVCTGGKPVLLRSPIPGKYQWSTGSVEPEIAVRNEGVYVVDVTDACGTFSFTWHVQSKTCNCALFVPDAFTPNGDGRNDYFHPSVRCDYELTDFYFTVYNRWGQAVHKSFSATSRGWDGTANGVAQPLGTYFWTLRYTVNQDGIPVLSNQSGDCILIR